MVREYDPGINYHSGKSNVVADGHSRKSASLNAMLESLPLELQQEIAQLNLVIIPAGLANILEVTPTVEEDIRIAQADDKIMQVYLKGLQEGKTHDFSRDAWGTLRFQGRICVPEQADLRKKILAEAHESSYSIHPGGTKMYEDLR